MLKAKPQILFNPNENSISFSGIFIIKSLWEGDDELSDKIRKFLSDRKELNLIFDIQYLDSVSRKILFEMFTDLKSDILSMDSVTVKWNYEDEDESILELGEVLSNSLGIPFEFILHS